MGGQWGCGEEDQGFCFSFVLLQDARVQVAREEQDVATDGGLARIDVPDKYQVQVVNFLHVIRPGLLGGLHGQRLHIAASAQLQWNITRKVGHARGSEPELAIIAPRVAATR